MFENGSRTILAEGLAYDRCQVGVVTDLEAARHLGRVLHRDADQVFNVLRTQVDVVLPERRGGAECRRSAAWRRMASLCDGEVIFYAPRRQLPS